MTTENSSTPLGELIKTLREAAGLTRSQLALETGLSLETIRNLETGRYHAEPEVLQALRNSQSMQDLAERCNAAGIQLDLGANGVGGKL